MEKNKIILLKSLENKEISENLNELLAEYVGQRDNYDEFRIYRAIAYTTKIDRDGEKATVEFLYQMAEKVIGLTVIKNHDWSGVENTVGRVINSEVVDFEDGEKALIIQFYACEPDDIRKIDNGLYYGISMGFNAEHRSNECGTYDLVSCQDVYEVSLVSVPAVPDAHIIKTCKEGDIPMDEMEKMLGELDELKAENASLKEQLANINNQIFENEACDVLDDKACKAADEMEPSNDEVKGFIIEEIKTCGFEYANADTPNAIKLKSGQYCVFNGFDTLVDSVKTKYSKLGLLGKKENPTEEPIEKSAKVNPSVKFTNEAQKKSFESQVFIKSGVKII